MKRVFLTVFLLVGCVLASANDGLNEAQEVCKYIGGPDSKLECTKVVGNAKFFQSEALGICKYIGSPANKIQCFRNIKNKQYTEAVLDTCKYIGYTDKKLECLKTAGTKWAAHKQDKLQKNKQQKKALKKEMKNIKVEVKASIDEALAALRKGKTRRAEKILLKLQRSL